MENDDADSQDESFNIFQEPEGYLQPEKQPTTVTHTRLNGEVLTLRLIGHSPLWGHLLWNAAKKTSHHLESHPSVTTNLTILELGAGAGLPSITAALQGAAQVVVTDYPDEDLVANLRHNVSTCLPPDLRERVEVEGYLWGAPTDNLTAHLPPEEGGRFDVLILADVLFNHSEHGRLLATVQATLKRTEEARALVVFTPYRPWLLHKDLAFFDLAREGGMVVEKVFEERVGGAIMFPDDEGDEEVRRKVFGFEVRWGEV